MGKCKICGKNTPFKFKYCKSCYDKIMKNVPQYDELPSEGFDECILCGEPSNGYAFCKDCWRENEDDELLDILNEHLRKEALAEYDDEEDERDEEDEDSIEDNANELNSLPETENNNTKECCILCGEPSDGHNFCKKCYYKYKNKEILVKIKNCELPCGDPLDESYEGVYECDDGHIVKSQAERDIDNYLYENNIFHGYEQPLNVGSEKPLRPDFCLKNYLGIGEDVYIEYFGYTDDPQYDNRTAYKMPLYEKKGITLICMYAKTDLKNIRFALKTKLDKESLKKGKINYKID